MRGSKAKAARQVARKVEAPVDAAWFKAHGLSAKQLVRAILVGLRRDKQDAERVLVAVAELPKHPGVLPWKRIRAMQHQRSGGLPYDWGRAFSRSRRNLAGFLSRPKAPAIAEKRLAA